MRLRRRPPVPPPGALHAAPGSSFQKQTEPGRVPGRGMWCTWKLRRCVPAGGAWRGGARHRAGWPAGAGRTPPLPLPPASTWQRQIRFVRGCKKQAHADGVIWKLGAVVVLRCYATNPDWTHINEAWCLAKVNLNVLNHALRRGPQAILGPIPSLQVSWLGQSAAGTVALSCRENLLQWPVGHGHRVLGGLW